MSLVAQRKAHCSHDAMRCRQRLVIIQRAQSSARYSKICTPFKHLSISSNVPFFLFNISTQMKIKKLVYRLVIQYTINNLDY